MKMSFGFVKYAYDQKEYTKENLQLFVKIGWLSQESYDLIVNPSQA